ncbi:hypothetical protein D3C80_275060 [compost metagenome]
MHTCAASALVEHHQLFAFLKAPERRRQRTNVHGLRSHVQNMVQNTTNFREKNTDQLTTLRHCNAKQTLDSDRIGVFLIHRRHVVEAVEIRQGLKIGLRFHQLLGAAMQQTDMRIDAFYDLAVKFKNKTQNAVRSRMLRAEVNIKVADLSLSHVQLPVWLLSPPRIPRRSSGGSCWRNHNLQACYR